MKNNISDESKKFCSGCSACYNICPVKAIQYKINKYGFYDCIVDEEKCIQCGKCKKVCMKYAKDSAGNNIRGGILYAAQSADRNVIKKCTSGGIAYELAKYYLKKSYKIMGVVYDYKENIAKTIITDSLEDLEKIKGSKYIQADCSEAFKQLIDECKANETAKFIAFGTPCQISGLKAIIKNEKIKNDIITIDLFCHGVPSYLVWKNYLKWLSEKKKIKNIDNIVFRSKHIGWHDFCMEIHSKHKQYYKCAEGDLFYKAFFDNILLNNACFDCDSRMNNSSADIRLGDFWGKKYINRQDGISAILMLTEKGKSIITDMLENKIINLIEETSCDECFKSQSVNVYDNIEIRNKAFEELVKNEDLKTTIKTYRKLLNRKLKIKKIIKESTSILPDCVRSKLRRIK